MSVSPARSRSPRGQAGAGDDGVLDLDAALSDTMEDVYEDAVLDKWEPSVFRALFDSGDVPAVAGDPEVDDSEETILEASARIWAKYEQEVEEWDPMPSDVSRRALLVIALALDDETAWSKMNEILIARLFMLMYGKEFKGHADGVWRYRNGSYNWIEELPDVTLRGLESSFSRAKNFLLHIKSQNVGRDWESVFEEMKRYHNTPAASKPTCSTDYQAGEGEAVWALDLAKGLSNITTHYMSRSRSKDVVDTLGAVQG